jgi:hypothetical protein
LDLPGCAGALDGRVGMISIEANPSKRSKRRLQKEPALVKPRRKKARRDVEATMAVVRARHAVAVASHGIFGKGRESRSVLVGQDATFVVGDHPNEYVNHVPAAARRAAGAATRQHQLATRQHQPPQTSAFDGADSNSGPRDMYDSDHAVCSSCESESSSNTLTSQRDMICRRRGISETRVRGRATRQPASHASDDPDLSYTAEGEERRLAALNTPRHMTAQQRQYHSDASEEERGADLWRSPFPLRDRARSAAGDSPRERCGVSRHSPREQSADSSSSSSESPSSHKPRNHYRKESTRLRRARHFAISCSVGAASNAVTVSEADAEASSCDFGSSLSKTLQRM